MNAQVLTLSSKGQITLPISMRKALSLDTGAKLVAYSSGDSIMLKVIHLPTAQEFEHDMELADDELLALSSNLIEQNRPAYEVLAK